MQCPPLSARRSVQASFRQITGKRLVSGFRQYGWGAPDLAWPAPEGSATRRLLEVRGVRVRVERNEAGRESDAQAAPAEEGSNPLRIAITP